MIENVSLNKQDQLHLPLQPIRTATRQPASHTFKPQLCLGDYVARTIGRSALVLSLVCERSLVDDKRTGVVLDSHPHPPAAEHFKAVLVPYNFRGRYPVEMNYELRLKYKHNPWRDLRLPPRRS